MVGQGATRAKPHLVCELEARLPYFGPRLPPGL